MIFQPKPHQLEPNILKYVLGILSCIMFFYGISLGMNNYINMYLNEMGVTKLILRNIIQIGIVGALFIAPVMMKLLESLNIFTVILVSLILRSIGIWGLTIFYDIKFIMLLVFLIGLAEFCIFTCFWFWITSILPKKNLKLNISILYSALMSGVALSLVYLYQNNDYTFKKPFLYSVFCAFLALGLSYIIREFMPKLKAKKYSSKPSKIINFIMIPALSILISNYLYQSLSRFAPTYAMSEAYDFASSIRLFYFFALGNIILTPAFSFLFSKFGNRLSHMIISIISLSILLISIYFALNIHFIIPLIFLILGGLIGIMFTIAIDELGAKFSSQDLLMSVIIIGLMHKLGGYCGIFITGAAMEYWGGIGFIIAISVVSFFFLLYIVYHLNNEK